MKKEWIKLRYSTEDGTVLKEVWATTYVQGLPDIDRRLEDTIAEMGMPKITCDLIDRSDSDPFSSPNAESSDA